MFDGSARERSGVSLSMRRNGKKDTKTILEQSRIQVLFVNMF